MVDQVHAMPLIFVVLWSKGTTETWNHNMKLNSSVQRLLMCDFIIYQNMDLYNIQNLLIYETHAMFIPKLATT